MRTKAAYFYQLKSYLKLFGWSLLWTVAALVVVPLLLSVLLGQFDDYSLSTYVPGSLIALVLIVFLFVYGGITYDGFKLFIQNGIGRKTFFWSKTYALATITVIMEVINLAYAYMYHRFVTHKSDSIFAMSGLYGHYFKSALANHVALLLVTLLFFVCVTVTGMVLGSLLGLYSRRVQVFMIVGIPIGFIILIIVLVMLNSQSSLKLTWLFNFLVYLIGYSGKTTTEGHFNVFAPLISGSVYTCMMLLISFRLTLKLKVPR